MINPPTCLWLTGLALLGPVAAHAELIFDQGTVYPTGENSTGIATADFNHDGWIDLAISARNSNSVTLLLNDGSGGMTTWLELATALGPRYVAAADLNGDGDVDLATAGADLSVTLQLTGDPKSDFTRIDFLIDVELAWVGLEDINLDSIPDLLVLTKESPSRLLHYRNDGQANFTLNDEWFTGNFARAGMVADFDGDGWPDVAVCNLLSNFVSIFKGNGSGGLLPPGFVATFTGPRWAAAADFDGDGDSDLAVVHKTSNDLQILRNQGNAIFVPDLEDFYPTHDSPHAVAAADLDGDGDIDIVATHVLNDGGTWIDLYENDGTGAFTALSFSTPQSTAHVVIADLNGDGRPDLATANTTGGSCTVHLNLTPAYCPADLDGNDDVGFTDLLPVLGFWGDCPVSGPCPADLDQNGNVGLSDIIAVLAAWGPCGG